MNCEPGTKATSMDLGQWHFIHKTYWIMSPHRVTFLLPCIAKGRISRRRESPDMNDLLHKYLMISDELKSGSGLSTECFMK